MVHKKSEYMLQFHKMSKELRWHIYRDNVQFRNNRRIDNASDHYWSHQLTDLKCDCEKESSNEEEDTFIMPPAFKLKHKALLNAYNTGLTAPTRDIAVQNTHNSVSREFAVQNIRNSASSREIAVQTPDWLEPESRAADSPTLHYTHSAVNTDPDPKRLVVTSPPIKRPANPTPPQSPHNSCLISEPSFRNVDTPMPTSGNFINTASSGLSASRHTFRTSPPTATPTSREPLLPSQRTVERTKPSATLSASKDVQMRERPDSHFHSPTRTSRKLYHEGKKTHFVPYGWNDTQDEIGQKKTHNVCAPDDQVYSSALEALRLRRADVENQLALDAEKRRKLRGDRAPVNHSSLWMTEYRDKFRPSSSHPFSSRPQTASSLKPCVAHSTCHRPASYR